MRSLSVQDMSWEESNVPFASSHATETAMPAAFPAASTVAVQRWSDQRGRINWPATAIAIGFNALLLTALVTMDIVTVPFSKPRPTVVTLIELPKDPPTVPPPDVKVEVVEQPRPMVVAPPPLVRTPPLLQAPVMVQTAVAPAPVKAAVVAPSMPGPTGPVSVADLDSKMVSAKPPKYPVESRRKHEQGTVVLTVVLSTAGTVADVAVSRSSGSTRLDKAALEAVRRWIWSPTVQNGQPVMVKGIVEIPFVLSA